MSALASRNIINTFRRAHSHRCFARMDTLATPERDFIVSPLRAEPANADGDSGIGPGEVGRGRWTASNRRSTVSSASLIALQ